MTPEGSPWSLLHKSQWTWWRSSCQWCLVDEFFEQSCCWVYIRGVVEPLGTQRTDDCGPVYFQSQESSWSNSFREVALPTRDYQNKCCWKNLMQVADTLNLSRHETVRLTVPVIWGHHLASSGCYSGYRKRLDLVNTSLWPFSSRPSQSRKSCDVSR